MVLAVQVSLAVQVANLTRRLFILRFKRDFCDQHELVGVTGLAKLFKREVAKESSSPHCRIVSDDGGRQGVRVRVDAERAVVAGEQVHALIDGLLVSSLK